MEHSLEYGKAIGNWTLYQGNVVVRVDIEFDHCFATVLTWKSDPLNAFELETFLDSISIADGFGKEVVIEFKVKDIDNNGTFYTDSNGMEMQKRVRNFRPTWDLEVT